MSPGVAVPYDDIWGGVAPTSQRLSGGNVLVRNTFFSNIDGTILGAQFYRDFLDGGNHIGWIVKRGSPGNRILQRSWAFYRNAASTRPAGWERRYFQELPILANDWYDIIVWFGGDRSYYNTGTLATTRYVSGHIIVPADNVVDPFGITLRNGSITTALNLTPNVADGGNMNGVDIIFLPG
jgi:hypothetical protein